MGIQQGLSRCSCQGKQPQLWKRDGEKGEKCSNPTNPGGGTHRQAPEDGLQIPEPNFPGRAPFSPAMQGQELWEGGGQHSGRVSHKPSLQQRCPSQLQTGLLAPHSHPRSQGDGQTGQGRCRQTDTKHGRARRGQVSLSATHSASSGRKMKGKKNPPATINLLFLPFQDYF